jgi:hypothetical protein
MIKGGEKMIIMKGTGRRNKDEEEGRGRIMQDGKEKEEE